MTNYEVQAKQAQEDYEFINSEYKQITSLREDYIEPMQKQVENTNINELSFAEFNKLVDELNEYIEEFNSRIAVLIQLVDEQYKGVI